jgi:hypothetical protein
MFASATVHGVVMAAALGICIWGGVSYAYLAVFVIGMLTAFVEVVRPNNAELPSARKLGERVGIRTASGLLAVLALVILQWTRHGAADVSVLQTAQNVVAAALAAALLMRLPPLSEDGPEAIRER